MKKINMNIIVLLIELVILSSCLNHKESIEDNNRDRVQDETDCNKCVVANMIYNNDTSAYNSCYATSYCYPCETNEFGETSLMLAVNENNKWFVEKLSGQCNKCAKNQNGESALDIARHNGFHDLIEIINDRQPGKCN